MRILTIIIFGGSILFAALSYDPNPVLDAKKLDANNISTWFRNNGSFNYDPVNPALPGFEWPKGTNMFARFASGMWLGAKVGNDT